MDTRRYDRSTQDVGNIVSLEHVNVTQPDQGPTTLFYVVALGGTLSGEAGVHHASMGGSRT